MSHPVDAVEQTRKRLAEVEVLHQTLSELLRELTAYRSLLAEKLTIVQPEPEAQPEPTLFEEVTAPVAVADWLTDEPPAAVPVPPLEPPPPQAAPVPPAPRATPIHPVPPQEPAQTVPLRPKATRQTIHISPLRRLFSRAPTPPSTPEPVEEEAEPESSERRSAPRRAGNPVSVQITNPNVKSEGFQGWVVDRSSSGLRLLVDQAVPLDTVLNVRPAKALPSVAWVPVLVRSCRPERNSFNLGCQFVNKLSWTELQMFG